MFRTIKVSLPMEGSLLQTATAFNRACQMVLDYGSEQRTYNKNKLNRDTYKIVRNAIPNLPSALVQTARDQASEMLKRVGFRKIEKKRLSIRYDKRTFKFYPESNRVSLTTVFGRLSFPFKHYAYMDHWKGEYTNAQLLIRGKKALLNVQVKIPDPPHIEGSETLGVDRGITNIAVCSDNTFYNSKHLRAVKGRYQHNKQALQSVGTRSAKRHLRRLSGRERRFARSVNHRLSKAMVAKPCDVIALENLILSPTWTSKPSLSPGPK
ncbi:transposase [Patescibacteria group bacterium]|nr:transposase [Patescibacteria group bacterium]